MFTYIVLGQIPGTNIQLSFQAWIIITIAAIVFAPSIYRYFTVDLNKTSVSNDPMPANRLHVRAK